jgi:glycosyltransferase involved in cell wall biosynthesis
MKILYDARKIVPKITGVGHVSESLLRELLKYKDLEIIAFTKKGVSTLPQFVTANSNLKIHEVNDTSDYFGFKRLWFEQVELLKLIDLYKPDVLHLTNGFSVPFLLNKNKYRLKIVLTIHDLIPLTDCRELMSARDVFFYKILLDYSIKKSDAIVSISMATKRDIEHYFPHAKNIEIINNGIDLIEKRNDFEEVWQNLKKKYAISDKYIFYLGGFAPRKNVFSLLQAYCLLRKSGKINLQLVLAGKISKNVDIENNVNRIAEFIQKNDLQKDVVILEYLGIEDKSVLYINSTLFAYISLYEGFGLPVFEAISVDRPILTSKGSAMEEIIGEYGVYADPKNIQDIANKIETIVNNYGFYEKQSENARKNILPNFNWEKIGNSYYNLYKRLILRNE